MTSGARWKRAMRVAGFTTISCAAGVLNGVTAADAAVKMASKNFAENRLLAEMFAQLIEARTDLEVERKFGLAGTQVCFEALRTGAVDIYPEYTGTGLVTILDAHVSLDATATLDTVRAEFLRRWNLWWISPLGFENSFEIAVRRPLAEEHGLRTISDLARVSQQLTAGFGHEFAIRDDGLPGLERVYGLRFQAVRQMQQALQYEAASAGKIDCLDVYTTDGRLAVHDLVLLDDDRNFFPPYEACALVRGAALEEHPEIGAVLGLLASGLDASTMRQLNRRVETNGEPIETVAHDALAALGLVGGSTAPAQSRTTRAGSVWSYMWSERSALAARTLEHLGLTGAGLGLGILVAVPLGLWLERRRRIAEPFVRAVGTTQTIPSLALLAFMVPVLGIGAVPAIAALWLYAIFPILRNTYTGVRDAAPAVVHAARAAGMTDMQVLRWVRAPLAVPVVLAGIRTSAVLTVGTATLAAFVGAGGLGEPIVSGVQAVDSRMILAGALPAAALALGVDAVLGLLEHRLRPRGLEPRQQSVSRPPGGGNS